MMFPDFKTIGKAGAVTVLSVITVYLVWQLGENIPYIRAAAEQLIEDHQLLKEAVGQKLDEANRKTEEGNRIQCAACWNVAGNQEEILRCGCEYKN